MARKPSPKASSAPRPRVAAVAAVADRDFVAAARMALKRNEPDAISDARLQQVLAAAVKLYAAKSERRSDLKPFREGTVTTTEAVIAACALIRAADLNLFDVAMWFNRPPAAS